MEKACDRCGGVMYTPLLGPVRHFCGLCLREEIKRRAIDMMTPDELRALADTKEQEGKR